MARDPWLDSVRELPEFTKLLRDARAKHREAVAAFDRVNGHVNLGLSRYTHATPKRAERRGAQGPR
jgi:hypothetical protein